MYHTVKLTTSSKRVSNVKCYKKTSVLISRNTSYDRVKIYYTFNFILSVDTT